MVNIPEAEARALLDRPLRCDGEFAWSIARNRPASLVLSGGIMELSGIVTRMEFELSYRRNARTAAKYLFSVYLRRPYGKERVYQLDVTLAQRGSKDMHAASHEHMGDRRSNGQTAWQNWAYDDVLGYFCSQTNITFEPSPPDPACFWRARQP